MYTRNQTRVISIGDVKIGGGNPVAIQSMTNTKTENVEETVKQILALEKAGCQIIRCTVPTMKAAEAFTEIKKQIHIPLVADIHFDYKLAIDAAEAGISKLRINPGNIGGDDRVRAVAKTCARLGVPVRVGVNGGSLAKKIAEKYGAPTAEALERFTYTSTPIVCKGCTNACRLSVSTFDGGRRYISGNKCDKPLRKSEETQAAPLPNLFEYKRQLLSAYRPVKGTRGVVGIPMGLNFYENLPFWHAFFTTLGYEVIVSPPSTRNLYLRGQATIPSDTVCYPAKLMHGHVEKLLEMGVDAIFYPCLPYNFDEERGDNHYNCPVVAYYPEVLAGNCPELEGKKFIYDYVGIHRPKDFVHKMAKQVLPKYFGGISEKEVQAAADAAYAEYEAHMAKIRVKGSEIIDEARRQGKRIIVLAGRPYHVDPEVNHGIDHLITRHGAAVVTEDSISNRVQKFPTSVLNQWTYHSRLYAAAKYCTTQKDMDLVQLVSFGCGVDAITTDETREILQRGNKLYTQLKIDEITNLGAVNIRLRSLFAALDERDEAAAEKAE